MTEPCPRTAQLPLLYIWLMAAAVIMARHYLSLDGILLGDWHVVGRDFANIYSGAAAGAERDLSTLYDASLYQSALDARFGTKLEKNSFPYPPHAPLLMSPLGWLDYVPALIVWTLGGVTVFAATCRLWVGRQWLWLAAAPAVVLCIWAGQSGIWVGALLALGLLILPKRPVLAGLLFAAITFKPQFGPLLVIALLASGSWRAIMSASVATLALVAASVLAFGVQPWTDFLAHTAPRMSANIGGSLGIFDHMVHTPFKWVVNFGGGVGAAWALQAVFMAATAWLTFRLFRSDAEWATKCGGLMVMTFLFSPYIANYDMPVLMLGLLLLDRMDGREELSLWMLAAMSLPMIGMMASMLNVPLTVMALSAVLVVKLGHFAGLGELRPARP